MRKEIVSVIMAGMLALTPITSFADEKDDRIAELESEVVVLNETIEDLETQIAALIAKYETGTEAETSAAVDASEVTMGMQNAYKSAKNYLSFTSFSRSGLIDQLEFEGYSTAEAEYAVDKDDIDWKEQAAKKAEEYLDFMSFSRSGLIDQLEYEGFSAEEAEYGATAVGY